jgi:hypothetical protein
MQNEVCDDDLWRDFDFSFCNDVTSRKNAVNSEKLRVVFSFVATFQTGWR